MKKYIKNSNNEDLCIQIFDSNATITSKKLAIICHGITGYKEQDVIIQTAKTLTNCGYKVVTFDCRNSRGESFNNHSSATLSSMFDDLQSIINWVKAQDFYNIPFLLAGHSLGGSVVLNYAEQHPDIVNRLILISSIFDGNELLHNTQENSPEFLNLLQNGGIIRTRNSVDCYLDCSYLDDFRKYNLYANIDKLKMPVLVISGDKDIASTAKDNEHFYQRLKCEKEIYILQDCSHIYDTLQNQLDLSNKIENFLTL